MKTRCSNTKVYAYKNYGGRGSTLCEEWKDFAVFHAAVGDPPSPAHTIDRIDNSKGYEPGNVRWATVAEQSLNTRRCVMLTKDGVTLPINEWCRRLDIPYVTVKHRRKRGWGLEEAVFTPVVARHISRGAKYVPAGGKMVTM
jgi:hypothetical protein